MALTYMIEVQPAALRDMEQIVAYLADKLDNPAAAECLAADFVDAIQSLSRLPSRCPLYMPLRPLRREYRRLTVGNYLVFFSVSEEVELVTVARVLYGRRDLEAIL